MNEPIVMLMDPGEVVMEPRSSLATMLARVEGGGHALRRVHLRGDDHPDGASGYAECRTCGWAIWFVAARNICAAHVGTLRPCGRQRGVQSARGGQVPASAVGDGGQG